MADSKNKATTTSPKAGSGRSRRSRAELETMLLGSARELLVADGISLGLDNITFKRVFDHLEQQTGVRVTHSSVIERIWRDQDEFHLAVIDSVLKLTFPEDPLFAKSLERMIAVMEKADRSTPEGRWAGMFEVCRVGAADNLALLQQDDWWPLWMNVWTHLATAADGGDAQLLASVRSNYHASDEIYQTLYSGIMVHLGFQVTKGFTLDDIDSMLAWAAEGAAIRQRVDPDALKPQRHEGKMWTPLGLNFKAIMMLALELVPSFDPEGH